MCSKNKHFHEKENGMSDFGKYVPVKRNINGIWGYHKYEIDMYSIKYCIYKYYYYSVNPIGINIFPISYSL